MRQPREMSVTYAIKRAEEYRTMTHLPAWGDFAKEITAVRNQVMAELMVGSDKRTDDTLRGQLYCLNEILKIPLKVMGDAEKARAIMDRVH